jgi:hypothetical protein
MYARVRACIFALAVGSCGGGSTSTTASPLVCDDVDASTSVCEAGAGPTYAAIEPIVAKSCLPCHNDPNPDPDGGDTWPLITYDDVAGWTSVVKEDILNCSMPPADGGVPMTAHDRDLFVQWILCGAPP